MSMADRPAGQPERPGSRRLTRSSTDRKIAGVCGGFAAYSGIDANIVRLVMVLLAVPGGGGVVLYLVAWAIIPAEDAAAATGNGNHGSASHGGQQRACTGRNGIWDVGPIGRGGPACQLVKGAGQRLGSASAWRKRQGRRSPLGLLIELLRAVGACPA